MGGQTIARREIVRLLGIAAVAATYPGFSRWPLAGTTDPAVPAGELAVARNYRPLFFSPAQLVLIGRLPELTLPVDVTPWVLKSGLGPVIDFMPVRLGLSRRRV